MRVQQRSIVIEKEQRLPRLMGSARDFLDYAERQGLRIDPGAFDAADRYGDIRSDLSNRASESPFETPPAIEVVEEEMPRFQEGSLLRSPPVAGNISRSTVPVPPPAPSHGRRREDAPPADERASLRADEARLTLERCSALEARNLELERKQAELRAELARAGFALEEAVKQRELYHLSANAAEERARLLQLELNGPADERGADKRFNALRRYLARELHPDLAGENADERAIRETIFKRVWAKIEQLQA